MSISIRTNQLGLTLIVLDTKRRLMQLTLDILMYSVSIGSAGLHRACLIWNRLLVNRHLPEPRHQLPTYCPLFPLSCAYISYLRYRGRSIVWHRKNKRHYNISTVAAEYRYVRYFSRIQCLYIETINSTGVLNKREIEQHSCQAN